MGMAGAQRGSGKDCLIGVRKENIAWLNEAFNIQEVLHVLPES